MGSCGCLHRGARCPSQFFARQEAWPPSTSALWGAMVLVARPPPDTELAGSLRRWPREKETLATPRVPLRVLASSAPGSGGIGLPTNPATKADTTALAASSRPPAPALALLESSWIPARAKTFARKTLPDHRSGKA